MVFIATPLTNKFDDIKSFDEFIINNQEMINDLKNWYQDNYSFYDETTDDTDFLNLLKIIYFFYILNENQKEKETNENDIFYLNIFMDKLDSEFYLFFSDNESYYLKLTDLLSVDWIKYNPTINPPISITSQMIRRFRKYLNDNKKQMTTMEEILLSTLQQEHSNYLFNVVQYFLD